jgi:hypothetical protein
MSTHCASLLAVRTGDREGPTVAPAPGDKEHFAINLALVCPLKRAFCCDQETDGSLSKSLTDGVDTQTDTPVCFMQRVAMTVTIIAVCGARASRIAVLNSSSRAATLMPHICHYD